MATVAPLGTSDRYVKYFFAMSMTRGFSSKNVHVSPGVAYDGERADAETDHADALRRRSATSPERSGAGRRGRRRTRPATAGVGSGPSTSPAGPVG